MGFKKLLGIDSAPSVSATAPASPAAVETTPPVVTETQEVDTQADYAQRNARKKGLLSTLLSDRNRTAGLSSSSAGGNKTLG